MKKLIFCVTLGLSLNIWAQTESLANAVEMDDVSKVSKMIKNGQASVDEKLSNGDPILLHAARAGSEKVINFLIANHVDVNALNSVRESSLMMAVFFGDSSANDSHAIHDRIAKVLVESGAHLENENWWAPLAYAAYPGRLEIARYLVEHGALIDGPVVDGIAPVNTPLMMASLQDHEKFVLFLLEQGADAKIKNSKGGTAYSMAEKYNFKSIMKYLKCAMNLGSGEIFKDKCK